MKTRQQAAREYADKACDTTPRKNDGYPLTRTLGELKDDAIQYFLAGCEHVDKKHRDFYLLVRDYFSATAYLSSHAKNTPERAIRLQECQQYTKLILQRLDAFTEREQTSLPFKD